MNKVSLRIRIFLAMLLLVGLASVLIAVVTVKQYKKQTKEYYYSRFDRKERAAQKNINYELENTIYPAAQQFLGFIFRERIYEIATVHKMKMSIYDLNGRLQINSYEPWFRVFQEKISQEVLNQLKRGEKYEESTPLESGNIAQLSYSYINDRHMNKVGILKVEYVQDNTQEQEQLSFFLNRLFLVYGIMFLLAIVFAYFLSSYITSSLQSISSKLQKTKLLKKNEKINTEGVTPEIASIVGAYNLMIDELEESANKLAKSEREQAWREMAKQVAHEIKNPLTPMKLTVQSFERTFDPNEEGIREKVKDYAEMLTQQIDVMSSIATSFSDFARMPQKNIETIELISVVKNAIDIFYEKDIKLTTNADEVLIDLDKNQMTRVLNNLVKNSIQATEFSTSPEIKVSVTDEVSQVIITVEDNGKGIQEKDKEHIFEPKFTTKSSGMGLGLPMVKNIVETYGGTISFESILNKGTIFKIKLPKNS
ncbi:sensor histidine kinase [Wenyingzhuangia sp. IMCC45533]